MAEAGVERTLAIKITPKLDIEALTKQIREAVVSATSSLNLGKSKEGTSAAGMTFEEKKQEDGVTASTGSKTTGTNTNGGKNPEGTEKTSAKEAADKVTKVVSTVGSVVKTGFGIAQQTFTGIFGIIQEIHNKVKQSSQFLSTVENLFNLAMTLLLLPLGNALAEVILPSTMTLVESIIGLWDKFEEFAGQGDLKSMIGLVMTEGVKLIGQYFHNLSDIFVGTGDTLLTSIGELFNTIGNFIEHGKATQLLQFLFNIFEKFTAHMDIWIPAIIAYQGAMLGATLGAAAGPGIGLLLGAIGAGTGFAAGAYLMNADGGEYPQSSGGTLVRVAEHEPEVIIPKSKADNLENGKTIINNFNGFTSEEIRQIIRDELRTEVSNSYYRSGL